MRELAKTMLVIALIIIECATGAHAWDVEYDAGTGLLPTAASPAWQSAVSDAPTTIVDGALHINSVGGGAGYRREEAAIGTGVPVTMEARMYVLSTTSGAADLTISTYSGQLNIAVFPDHIVTSDRYYQSPMFWQDFTTFHTIRLAYDGNAWAYVWMDNQLALSWAAPAWSMTTGPPGGISFGSYLSNSYWQYVGYSKEFLPVPEPSSLAALGLGLVPLAAAGIRRRRQG